MARHAMDLIRQRSRRIRLVSPAGPELAGEAWHSAEIKRARNNRSSCAGMANLRASSHRETPYSSIPESLGPILLRVGGRDLRSMRYDPLGQARVSVCGAIRRRREARGHPGRDSRPEQRRGAWGCTVDEATPATEAADPPSPPPSVQNWLDARLPTPRPDRAKRRGASE